MSSPNSSSPDSIVPYTERAIPEARTSKEFADLLSRSRKNGLPGFIVRTSGLIDIAATTQQEIAQLALELMQADQLIDDEYAMPMIIGGTAKLESHMLAPGAFHHDLRFEDSAHLRVHETEVGAGKVFLANAGTLGSRFFDDEFQPAWTQAEKDALRLFKHGYVEPKFVNPNVMTADLGPHDKILFQTVISSDVAGMAGPVWHSFDTDIVPRIAQLVTVSES